MANKTIPDLTAGAAVGAADLFEASQSAASVKITAAQLLTYVSANLDATLVAVAGVTFAANKGLYATGADAFATYDLTAGGRALGGVAGTSGTFPYFSGSNVVTLGTITAAGLALLDDADTAAQRTTLGLVIGTNVQAYDADLAAIAGLTSAADRVPYFTGSGTAALATFTAGGRALVGLTGAANKVGYFTGSGTAALADYEMVTANSSHTPVLAGSTGGTPTATTNTCTFLRNGSLVDVDINLSAITLNGATGNLTLTMPFTANRPRTFVLEEYVAVGFSVLGFMSAGSNILTLKKLTDNSSVLVAGYGFRGGGTFRV